MIGFAFLKRTCEHFDLKGNKKYHTFFTVKGTLVQIWKSPHMTEFKQKQYPGNFAFLILRIFKLFTREVYYFLKSRLIFNIFYSFWMFVKNITYISRARISKSKRCFNVKSSTLFSNEDIDIDRFQICISVPFKAHPR